MQPQPSPDHHYKQILLRKLSCAIFSSFVSHLIVLLLFIFAVNFNPLRPLESFRSSATTTPWFSIAVPFIFAVFAQTVICSKEYVAKRTCCKNRFEKIIHFFSFNNLLPCFLQVVSSSAIVWTYYCVRESKVRLDLDAESAFVYFNGVLVGLYFLGERKEKDLEFPVIQQKKFLQVKARLVPLFLESKNEAIWPTIYVTVLFCFGGKYVFDSSFTVFAVCLKLFVLNTIYVFGKNLTNFFFILHLTEAIEFNPDLQSTDSLKLQESVILDSIPIIQNLACLDLYLLSFFSQHRRQVLYSISIPGGHPHNWDHLIKNLLNLFKNYTDTLNASIDLLLPNEPTTKLKPTIKLPTQTLQPQMNIRNASVTLNDSLNILNISHKNPNTSDSAISEKLDTLTTTIKRKLGYDYLFEELPSERMRRCLAEGRVILWAAQGLSWLCTASLTEDRYGVVQRDLGTILTALVELKKCLDRMGKVQALAKKQDGFGWRMKMALASAVKRSLVNVCDGFRGYLGEFGVSAEVLEVLKCHTPVK